MGVRVALVTAWLTAFVASRFALAPLVHPEWWTRDSRLGACIHPFQMMNGWPQDTSYLPHWAFVGSFFAFDFGIVQAQLVTISFLAIALAFYGAAFIRIFGPFCGWVTLAVVLVTIQFITRPIVPTVATSAFWFTGPILYLLSTSLTPIRVSLIALLLGATLMTYPAGMVLAFPLVGLHFLLFRRSWGVQNTITFSWTMMICLAWVWVIRVQMGNPQLTHWGWKSVQASTTSVVGAIFVMLRDVFISSNTYCAYAGDQPYLAYELTALLLVSVIVAWRSHWRWILLFIGAFLASIGLASISSGASGVRRILPSTLLLIPISLLLLQILWEKRDLARTVAVAVSVLIVASISYHSVDVLMHWEHLPFKIRHDNRAALASSLDLLEKAGHTHKVTVSGPVPSFDACTIYFSKRARGRFDEIKLGKKASHSQIILEKGSE